MDIVNENCYSKTNILHVVSDIAQKLYYYVQWTGRFLCKSDFYIKRSNFDSYLLLYTTSGNASLNYKGKTYQISSKTLMLIDCRHLHEYYSLCDNWEFKYLHFNGALSRDYYEYITDLYNSVVFPAGGNIEDYMDEIYRLTKENGAEEICSDYIYRILSKIVYGYRLERDIDISPPWLTQAINYISKYYHQNIQVETIAELSHFSRCHFSTLFKNYTGFSPHQYITNFRIAEAKRLLYSTPLSIDAISLRCGFQNTSSFIRAFKNKERVSPLAFRKSKNVSGVALD